jgi:ribonuclease P protein component
VYYWLTLGLAGDKIPFFYYNCIYAANIPTKKITTQASPWLPLPDENPDGPHCFGPKTGQGPQAADRINMAKLSLLKTEADFAQFRSSRPFQAPQLRIRVVSAPDQNVPRFGFIVPKKVLAKAADRNKLKRRLKGLLVRRLSDLKPRSILFFPAAGLLRKTSAELEAIVAELFRRANLWKS